jgi:hypothetical protein
VLSTLISVSGETGIRVNETLLGACSSGKVNCAVNGTASTWIGSSGVGTPILSTHIPSPAPGSPLFQQ